MATDSSSDFFRSWGNAAQIESRTNEENSLHKTCTSATTPKNLHGNMLRKLQLDINNYPHRMLTQEFQKLPSWTMKISYTICPISEKGPKGLETTQNYEKNLSLIVVRPKLRLVANALSKPE
ncbi:hypothetical protein MPTK2_3g17310 [Marchantia polymorpha subsp. ruderalis]